MSTPARRPAIDSQAQSGLPMAPRTLAAFLIAVVVVAVIALLSYTSMQATAGAAQSLTQAIEIEAQLQAVLSTLKDAETGQRGYLLTGRESYLEPFSAAKQTLTAELDSLLKSTRDNPSQKKRMDSLQALAAEKMSELQETVTLRQAGQPDQALAIVLSDRGKDYMDRIRAVVIDMESFESQRTAERTVQWQKAATQSFFITWGGSAVLLFLIATAAAFAARDFRTRQRETWLRTGQIRLNELTQGDQGLHELGQKVLAFLADYMNAQVGALFIAENGLFRRVAAYALPAELENETVRPGDGLTGQAAKANRPLLVRDVPDGYLPVASATGIGTPAELLIAPASVDRVVHAVLELGFFGATGSAESELLVRVCESIGVAVRASKDRSRLEELLLETQQQAEELQTGEEELRVNNEELEEQSRTLRESRAQLESQQAELEQINSHLEEQTQALEDQKEELSKSHAILSEKTDELQRANEYKSEFLANMSHELRTPLNSTLILAKLLADNKEGNLTDQQVKFAQTISSAGNDLLVLINDVLDLSRIEAGKIDLAAESVSIAKTLESLAKIFQPAADQKKLAYSAVIDPGTPTHLETDPQRLGQILKNLVSNALKFTENGQVGLRVYSASSGSVAFAVRDSGVGIAANQQAVIFEAFRQADGSIHRKYGGTGLGLSISKDLAHLLGGTITVQSAPGEGSVFTLTLPVTLPLAASSGSSSAPQPLSSAYPSVQSGGGTIRPTTAQPGEARPGASRSVTQAAVVPGIDDDRNSLSLGTRVILVIEDDVAFAAILRDVAREMGFQCIISHSANDGLNAAAEFHPSAILLDINLPDYSGLGVLDQLKRDPRTRHIPVHVASVADYRREALELGAVGYALKPAKREELVAALRTLEEKFSQSLRRVLIVEDDPRQRESIVHLLANGDVQIIAVENAGEALDRLRSTTFDCMVMDLNLPDYSGYDLLERMAQEEEVSFPPVIVYTGRALTLAEEQRLRRYSKSIIIKDARSPERLLDEVTLFLHQVESKLPAERQQMLKVARHRESSLDGRRLLVVEDDVRNIFALSSVLEPKGAQIEIARNGIEALDTLARSVEPNGKAIDMVLMDIMMPEMDGMTAMREIRKITAFKKLPIIALTAKAMKDDQEKCLAAGANDYIAKPLDVEKLLSLVRVWMPK